MSQGVRPTQQARSRETRDRLVRALDTKLREKAFADVTIAELADAAGLSVGAVYRRFENKDAFIPVIFELYRERLEIFMAGEGRLEIEPAEGLRAALHAACRTGWRFLDQHGYLVRAAHIYSRLRPDLIGDDWEAMLDQARESAKSLLDVFGDEVKRTDRAEAAQMFTYLMNTLPIERAIYPDEGAAAVLTLGEEQFVAAIADTLYGYLVTPDRGQPDG
ncbi:transcriptional regulator, TetR family [Maricaulis maris MCS10]|jgi:AcrR family transcriptional regulator|uniref:Transcriptional regulator, TetR family n=1 Tax=Maricaulis maris (strain MCS10) TaxID=394221 RepID=Q0ATT6_MARMM|nr:transcriptional regulator, TetR family [Maricaulis maris MCS10]